MWQKGLFRLTLTVTACIFMSVTALASGKGPVLRVGLHEGQGTTTVSCADGMTLYKGNSLWKTIKPAVPITVAFQNGAIRVNGAVSMNPVTLKPAKSGASLNVGGAAYRGDVQFMKSPKRWGMTIVNEVALEDYLYGVVGKEMSPSWPTEALKAQAVAARTYAMAHKGSFSERGFDVTNDTYSQVYKGISAETMTVRQAVDATRGEILTYGGKPIDAMFSTSGGGYTEHSENVWGSTVPYLRGVADASNEMPDYRWQVTTTAADMQRKLAAAGKNVGTVKNIVLSPLKKRPISALDRGISGRVKTMTIIGDKGLIRISGNTFQKIYGLRSTLFDFYQGAGLPAEIDSVHKSLRKESLSIHKTQPLVIYGYGWGHGLGMSQWGANQMANHRMDYRSILLHYYSNSALVKLY